MNSSHNDTLAVQASSLTKYFWERKEFLKKTRITAVSNVNLQIHKGEIFGILGPNGAGKTTLIKMLCSLIVPDKGEAAVNGYTLRDENKLKASIGLILSNERSFYWRLTGRQNLEFFGTLYNMPARALKQKIDDILHLVGLDDAADVWFQNYSSGMRQRLAICRGLLHDPRVLFMDEPTKGLDPHFAGTLRAFIKAKLSREQGKTIIIVTHQIQDALEICDKIAVMDKGEIRVCGNTDELVSHEGSLYNLYNKITGCEKWNV